jgi:hypothetical protein
MVRVRLSDPRLAEEFIAFLRRADWIAGLGEVEAHAEGITVEVELPEAYDKARARTELELYLRGWEAVYPDSVVELLA